MRPPSATPRHLLKAVSLTDAYAGATTPKQASSFLNQLAIFAYYTPAAGETANTCSIQVEFSPEIGGEDDDLYMPSEVKTYSGGDITLTDETLITAATDAGTTRKKYWLVPITGLYYRIRAKETGKVTTFGTLDLRVVEHYN